MSMNKWRQRADEKAVVERQNAEMLNTFKKHKIEKEFGKQASEELFKPITKRLGAKKLPAIKEEEAPDYGMDEFDRLNPFDEDFRPDEESPSPTPPATPPLTDDDEDEESPSEKEEEEEKSRKQWEAPTEPPPDLPSESTDLQNINKMLTISEGKTGYKVGKGKFKGFTRKQLFEAGAAIYERRGEKPPPKYGEFLTSQAPQAVEDDDLVSQEVDDKDWETEGSGVADVDALVNQLYISVESIKAGNTSLKLREQVKAILNMLVSEDVMTKTQARKIFSKI